MKNLICLATGFFFSLSVISQSSIEQRIFKEKTFYKIGGKWHLFDEPGQKFYTLCDTIISIKLNSGTTQSQIEDLETTESLKITKLLETGWADFTLTAPPDILNRCESLDSLAIVEEIEITTSGISLLQANDSTLQTTVNNPIPPQWSIAQAEVDKAWNYTTGDTNVIIAVIDNGVNWWPPDFRQASNTTNPLWTNRGEDAWADPDVPGGNGLDDDGNGFIDDWRGWNFINGSNDVRDEPFHAHGTGVASIAVARTNNSEGMAGVAGGWGNNVGARMMIVKILENSSSTSAMGAVADDAILYAAQHGADVINISLALFSNEASISDAIELAYQKYNCVIVAASGNDSINTKPVRFPAKHPLVLGTAKTNLQDRTLQSHTGPNLDLSAPGHNLPIINGPNFGSPGPKYTMQTGSSLAAPFVSGIAALMLSANPCMNSYDVADILRYSADKVNAYDAFANPSGYKYGEVPSKPGHYKRIGYGRVNAKRAVQAALAYQSDSLDLYIKDHFSDFGFPNSYPDTSRFDDWSDIWVRNQPDGHLVHEMDTVEYLPGRLNYVYVRIRNKSCTPSKPQDSLSLYWSRLSLVNSWPQNWDGSNPSLGNVISNRAIPVLDAGEDTILEIPWNIQGGPGGKWGVCLMARINSTSDPIIPYPGKLNDEIRFNNNIAARNLHVMSLAGKKHPVFYFDQRYAEGVYFYSGNISGVDNPIDIQFDSPFINHQPNLIDDAEVKLHLGQDIWEAYLALTPDQIEGIEIWDEKTLLITSPHARIRGLNLPPGKRDSIFFAFNYLAEEIDSTLFYRYHITQYQNEQITGSVNFNIERSHRDPFSADAGPDKFIHLGDSVTLQAANIGETAEYSWFNQEGVMVAEGLSLTVGPEETSNYILQVQAEVDLYKDYDEVVVNVLPYALHGLSPNPAQSTFMVQYDALGAFNAYLMLTNASNGSTVKTVPLNSGDNYQSINVANLSNGQYLVILVCDGQIVDSKNLQIQ